MKARWRILIVVVPEPTRGARFANAEMPERAPREAASRAARLLRLGAEVKLLDADAEMLSPRVLAREASWWHADLVLFEAGGCELADDPMPDPRPLERLLKAKWPAGVPLVLVGALGRRYGAELLAALPRLTGVHHGDVGPWMVRGFEPETAPGLQTRQARHPSQTGEAEDRPGWHLLSLEAYPLVGPGGLRAVPISDRGADLEGTLEEVRHAVQRAGARHLVFEARDLGLRPEFAIEVGRRMFGAAPGVTWSCRVRADHLDPTLALALAQGACAEVLVTSPAPPEAPGLPPMDDPHRELLEAALEAVRVTGMVARAEFIIGRPGHRLATLEGWQRWFAVRGVPVTPRVRMLHAGDQGEGVPDLATARARAGCWDNELSPGDVEKVVRRLSDRSAVGAGS